MGSDLINRTAVAAGEWWAKRLGEVHADKSEAFGNEVARRVEKQMRASPGYPVFTECDYDPRGLLLEAVQSVGIQCRGSFFSADGILPRKHALTVEPGRLEPKEGYGNWTVEIEVQ